MLTIFLILYTLLEYFYNVSKKKNIEKKSIKRHFYLLIKKFQCNMHNICKLREIYCDRQVSMYPPLENRFQLNLEKLKKDSAVKMLSEINLDCPIMDKDRGSYLVAVDSSKHLQFNKIKEIKKKTWQVILVHISPLLLLTRKRKF